MVKLQLKLDPRQTDIVIQALECAERHTAHDVEPSELATLRSWLRWRRDKLWGTRDHNAATASAETAIASLRDKLSGDGNTVGFGAMGGH